MRTLLFLLVVVGLSFELIPCDIDLKLASKTEKKVRLLRTGHCQILTKRAKKNCVLCT